jgi:fibronectin-binding autotransporter adhesin
MRISIFGMSGGLITINSGVKVVSLNNGTNWTGNLADMQLDGALDLWDNNNVAKIDALNGSGSIVFGYPWNANRGKLEIGLDNGSGSFSGSVQAVHFTGNGVNLIKSGSGIQTFDNLASQPFRSITINEGSVNLSNAMDATLATIISGVGHLNKTGTGVLTLTGSVGNSGTITVSEGSLSVSSGLNASSNIVVSTGAILLLPVAGEVTVNSITLGSTTLPVGVYGASHPTYGAFFTGSTGSLKILPASGDNDGTWSALTAGNWSDAPNWQSGAIANGLDYIATFNTAAGVTVTLDSNRSLGQLVFGTSDYTISGTNTLTMSAFSQPSISVAANTSTRIESTLAGSQGLIKSGAATLILAGPTTYTGFTTVESGRLVIENTGALSPGFMVSSSATLELKLSANRGLAGGSISGVGNFVKSGTGLLLLGAQNTPQSFSLSADSLIDVQQGAIRNEWGNQGWAGNLSDLNVASGTIFDLWDANVHVDAITGSGTINKAWTATNTLTFGAASGTGSFSGVISNINQTYGGSGGGVLNLNKIGTGTQSFTGTTNFKGSLTVTEGTLSLGNGSENTNLSDAHSVTVENSAVLNLNFTGSDKVASVTLGGTTYSTPGTTYGASNFPAFFSGTGTLMIPGADYDTWATAVGVVGGPSADDDMDGMTNNQEYAFGLVPTSGSSVNPIVVPLSSAGTLSNTRRNSAFTAPLAYSIWYSTTLEAGSWIKDAAAVQGSPVLEGNVETVPVTISASLLTNPKLFLQVRAE